MMVWYAIAMVTVVAISVAAFLAAPKKNADLMGASAMVALNMTACNLVTIQFGHLSTLLVSPFLDFVLAMMIYTSWLKSAEQWKVVLVACLVAQMALHLPVIFMWRDGDLTLGILHTYFVSINVIFCVILATLGTVGAWHGVDYLRRWVSDRRRVPAVAHGRR